MKHERREFSNIGEDPINGDGFEQRIFTSNYYLTNGAWSVYTIN